MQSKAWKDLERLVATELRGERILRGANFSKKDVDVRVSDFSNLIVDAKYRQRWAHHKFLSEVVTKYCKKSGDMPILVTKHPRMPGACVCMELHHFGLLLDVIRQLRKES